MNERIHKLKIGLRHAQKEAMRRARNAAFYATDSGASETTRESFRKLSAEYVSEARRHSRAAVAVR